jgi:hypothetical protein
MSLFISDLSLLFYYNFCCFRYILVYFAISTYSFMNVHMLLNVYNGITAFLFPKAKTLGMVNGLSIFSYAECLLLFGV